MIRLAEGDLLASGAEALVNPVNCVGVAGKGLALAFRQRWPGAFKEYRHACDWGWLRPGRILPVLVPDETSDSQATLILHFPTKRHWRTPSRLKDIEAGLPVLAAYLREYAVRSVAVPALGCGLGGLDWETVRPAIEGALGGIVACDVLLYPPQEPLKGA
jgi:O-acetyl-ADP-ribose deacetylase (regulator of RNase III)